MIYDDFIYKFKFSSDCDNQDRELHVHAVVSYNSDVDGVCYSVEYINVSIDENFETNLYELLSWVNNDLKKDIDKDLDRRVECQIDYEYDEILGRINGRKNTMAISDDDIKFLKERY